MRAHKSFTFFPIMGALALFTSHSALGVNWSGPTAGNWFTGANWDTGLVPLSTEGVVIANNSSVVVDALGAVGLQLTLGNSFTNSPGILTVQNGGQGTSGATLVHRSSLFQISGANTQWTVNGRMGVQAAGGLPSSFAPEVLVSNGGTLQVNTPTINSYFDYQAKLTVTGTGSLYTHVGTTILYTGTFNFLNQAVVTTGAVGSASFADNIAVMNVSSGAQWTLPNLSVGSASLTTATGYAQLNLTEGGSITATSGAGVSAGTVGRINIGTGGLAGILNASQVNLVKSTSILSFNHTDAATLSASISGLGSVLKDGAGTATLTAVSPFTGATTVTGGTLHLTGATTGSVTTVGLSGTLSGTGTAGRVVLNGALSPGVSPLTGSAGLFTIGNNSTLGGVVKMELGGLLRGSQYDAINVGGGGNLTFGGDLQVTFFNGFAAVPGDSFDLFDGAFSGSFAHVFLPSLGGDFTWNTSQLETTGVISVVPEPSTALLLAAGMVLPALRRRRR